MSKIIVPGPKSVLTPEKEYEARYRTAEHARDMLFVGAIMGMAETIHQAGAGKYRSETNDEFYDPRPVNVDDAAGRIMDILDYCFEKKWNVAQEMLNWKKRHIANRIKEKIVGEKVLSESPPENTNAG